MDGKGRKGAESRRYHLWKERENGLVLDRIQRIMIAPNVNEKPMPAPAVWHSRAAAEFHKRKLQAENPGRRFVTMECWRPPGRGKDGGCPTCRFHIEDHGCA